LRREEARRRKPRNPSLRTSGTTRIINQIQEHCNASSRTCRISFDHKKRRPEKPRRKQRIPRTYTCKSSTSGCCRWRRQCTLVMPSNKI